MRPYSFMNPVIFDTNLLLDFFVFQDPKTSVLWEAAKERKFRTATCDGALSEILPISIEAKARCKDPLDQKFIDLTLSCSPALLISKDKLVLRCARHLRPLGSNILPPEKAIAILLANN